jgi:hypothetical protein
MGDLAVFGPAISPRCFEGILARLLEPVWIACFGQVADPKGMESVAGIDQGINFWGQFLTTFGTGNSPNSDTLPTNFGHSPIEMCCDSARLR